MHNQERPSKPATETDSVAEVIRLQWELLRRNTAFRAIAEKWVASEQFRNSHALTPEYRHFCRLAPRCALDWMLTVEQRLALARVQIEKHTWQLGKNRNFGPVTWGWRDPLARMSRKTAYDTIEVRALENARAPITTDMDWNAVPELFKRQFRVAVHPRMPSFAPINKSIEQVVLFLGIIARKLQAGDPLHEMDGMASVAFEHAAELHQLAGNYRLYRIAHGDYSNASFNQFFERIKQDFKGPYGQLFSGRKHESHRSYLGTDQDWKWYLEAESRGLNIHKSADLYKLAEPYYEDLRCRKMRGQAHPHAKAHGHTGSRISSRDKRNCRTAVKRHIQSIQKWIERAYPPLPPDPSKPTS